MLRSHLGDEFEKLSTEEQSNLGLLVHETIRMIAVLFIKDKQLPIDREDIETIIIGVLATAYIAGKENGYKLGFHEGSNEPHHGRKDSCI